MGITAFRRSLNLNPPPMKNLLRSVLAATAVAAALTVSSLAADDSGYVDFGKFAANPDSRYVEVNLEAGLLKFAAKIASAHDKDAAELLKNIKRVRVNVVGLDESNRNATIDRVQKIRTELEARGWEKVVTAREGKEHGGDDVMIFMKSNGEESIAGLVVTVIEQKGEAVLVNVVGDIRADQLAALGEKLDIKPLRQLKAKPASDKEV